MAMRDNLAERAAPPEPDAVLEAYGVTCGCLEPLLANQLRRLESGQILEVLSDEPAAREGIPAWCWLTGNPVVATVEEDAQRTRFYLQKK